VNVDELPEVKAAAVAISAESNANENLNPPCGLKIWKRKLLGEAEFLVTITVFASKVAGIG